MTLTHESSAAASTRRHVQVDVWTDLVCPWCYLAEHRLMAAIANVNIAVKLRLRSFQLHPEWPTGVAQTVPEVGSKVHKITVEEARQLEHGMTQKAAAEGLPFTIERPVSNTLDVHRLLHLANDLDVGVAFFADIQRQYFAGRLNPFDDAEMIAAAGRHGLPSEDVRRVLATDEYTDAVHADRTHAQALGVTGVPFMVFGNRLAIAGAQSVAAYERALEQAGAEALGS